MQCTGESQQTSACRQRDKRGPVVFLEEEAGQDGGEGDVEVVDGRRVGEWQQLREIVKLQCDP